MYIDWLWIHAGGLWEHNRSRGHRVRVARGATESDSSFFLSALQTSQVHPQLDIHTAKSMSHVFSNIATTPDLGRKNMFYLWLTAKLYSDGKQRIPRKRALWFLKKPLLLINESKRTQPKMWRYDWSSQLCTQLKQLWSYLSLLRVYYNPTEQPAPMQLAW